MVAELNAHYILNPSYVAPHPGLHSLWQNGISALHAETHVHEVMHLSSLCLHATLAAAHTQTEDAMHTAETLSDVPLNPDRAFKLSTSHRGRAAAIQTRGHGRDCALPAM